MNTNCYNNILEFLIVFFLWRGFLIVYGTESKIMNRYLNKERRYRCMRKQWVGRDGRVFLGCWWEQIGRQSSEETHRFSRGWMYFSLGCVFVWVILYEWVCIRCWMSIKGTNVIICRGYPLANTRITSFIHLFSMNGIMALKRTIFVTLG